MRHRDIFFFFFKEEDAIGILGVRGVRAGFFPIWGGDPASVLATIQSTVRNDTDKPLFIRNLKGQLKANGQTYDDVPAEEVDYERNFQSYPDPIQHASAVLNPETRIVPGLQAPCTLVLAFSLCNKSI